MTKLIAKGKLLNTETRWKSCKDCEFSINIAGRGQCNSCEDNIIKGGEPLKRG